MSEAPMPLDFAVKRFFPHGGVSKSQMLAAIRKGALRAEKIGRAYFVTAGSIREWRSSCRVNVCPQGSISGSGKAASPRRASEMLSDAMRLAWQRWGGQRLFTYVDPRKVPPTMERSRPVWGFCFYKAGWRFVGLTKQGLHILECLPRAAITQETRDE